MKSRSKFLFFLLSAVFLSSFCPAQETAPAAPNHQGAIVIDPALIGLNRLVVLIAARDKSLESVDLQPLTKKIEAKLAQAGISPAPKDDTGNVDASDVSIYIDVVNSGTTGRFIFRVRTVVSLSMLIETEPLKYVKDEVWSRSSTLSVASNIDVSQAITKVTLRQLDAFISDFNIANGKSAAAENKDIKTEEPTIAAKSDIAAAVVISDNQYAASKNGRAFHKSDCSSVKKILDENLVYYKSRDEAIQSGKRPCMRCKP